jgi:hypothetical protein
LRRKRDELIAAATDELAARRITWVDALMKLATDALASPGEAADEGRDRYVVNFFVDVDEAGAPTWLHLGPLVSPEVRREHTCDGVVRAFLRQRGRVVARGRRRRVVDPALRTVIEERDGGCRHPLCTATRWLHVHHIQHWEDGGATDPSNLCVLCPHHHRAHHHGEFTIEGDPEDPRGLVFRASAGWIIRPPERDRPRPPSPEPTNWQRPWGGPIYNVGLHWTA